MRKLISVLALVTIVWFVTTQTRTTVYLSTGEGARDAVSTTLAQDLVTMCNCDPDRRYGPPAPVLDPKVLPVDSTLKDNKNCPRGVCQPCFDCYGWQLFLTLNWPSKPSGEPDPAAYFGRPGYLGKVGWENFASVNELFGGGTPPLWEDLGKASRIVEGTSAVIHQNLTDYKQADHNWLTDQDRNLVRFELRVNRDEYEYIRSNKLYNQDGLYAAFTTGAGIDLPSGKGGVGLGSIETKAAWRIVPKDREEYFTKNYKTAKVKIPPSPDEVLVALVGLHIIKKTPNSPQWVWATFEHQDNVPMIGQPEPGKKYNFFNPSAPRGYKPDYNDPPARRSDRRLPVQTERVNPFDLRTIAINNAVHALISAKYPESVWKNYILISVQWPTEPVANRNPKSTDALPSGKPAPDVVANTTMETYMQNKDQGGGAGTSPGGKDRPDPGNLRPSDPRYGKSSCIGCHRLSAVTPSFKGKKGLWKTDYSTVFYKAK